MPACKKACLLALLVIQAWDCRGQKGQAPGGKEAARTPPQTDTAGPSGSLRRGQHVVHSLIHEASRVELWDRGLFMNLGSPDQHKYTRGGWRTGWGDFHGNGTLHADTKSRARLIFHDTWGGSKAVIVRARTGQDGVSLALHLDGRAVGSQQVGSSWSNLRFELKEPMKAGPHRITLVSLPPDEAQEELETPVQVQWVWMPSDKGGRPPSGIKVRTVNLGGWPRRALVASPPRRLSYHLVVPQSASLALGYAATRPVRFSVRLVWDRGEREVTLMDDRGKRGGPWKDRQLDLSPWAGKLVRLDLVTRGRGGRAAWAEPEVVCPGTMNRAPLVLPHQRARNLIYILIDTARQDVYRPFNHRARVHAPAMEALAAESVTFSRAYTNDNWTKPSVATLLSGLYSSTHRTTRKPSVLPRTVRILPEHLRAHGFQTAAFIANGYISDKFGFKRGWDTYRNYIREYRPTEAEHVYADALRWLNKPDRHDRRFFLYIQPIDPHVPYAVPRAYLKRYFEGTYSGPLGSEVDGYETEKYLKGKISLGEEDRDYIRALYQGEITYHDEHFGRFLDELREQGLLQDTLLVVSNDHGEEMFDHDKVGHGHSLHEELIRCPLLMRFESLLPPGLSVPALVGLVDVLPTLLELLGVPAMAGMEGTSLLGAILGLPQNKTGYVVSEFHDKLRSVRTGPYKLIASDHRLSLFDVTQDPQEHEDLAPTHPVAVRGCLIHLAEGLALPAKAWRLRRGAPLTRRHGRVETEIDPALRRQLEALGYFN